MGAKIKHLEFIQGVINRLASNSFQMKGWAVVLVAAILVLLARENRLDAAFVALVPVLAFWGLDGYFLWQERLYRALYDHVRILDDCKVDFSMKTGSLPTASRSTWPSALFSLTLVPLYGGLSTVAVCVMIGLAGQVERPCDQGVHFLQDGGLSDRADGQEGH